MSGQQRPEKNSRRGYSPDLGILTIWKTQPPLCYGATWSHTSKEILGFILKRNQYCLNENDEEIQELPAKNRTNHQEHLAQLSCPCKKEAFCLPCSDLQCRLWDIQNERWTNLAEKTQICSNTHDLRGFYEALKAIYTPSYQAQNPLQSTDGAKLLTCCILALSVTGCRVKLEGKTETRHI